MAVQLRINKTKNVGKSVMWAEIYQYAAPYRTEPTGKPENQYSYFFLAVESCITAEYYTTHCQM